MTRKEAIELVRKGTHAIYRGIESNDEMAQFVTECLPSGGREITGMQSYYFRNPEAFSDWEFSRNKPNLEIINLSDLTEDSRKQIGWVLKKDCEKYREAALKIANCSDFYLLGGVEFQQNSIIEERLKVAGVLELWFEPVYEEETFKVGDWVIKKDGAFNKGSVWDTAFLIDKIIKREAGGYYIYKANGDNNTDNKFRRATDAEIEVAKEAQKITLPNSKYEIKVSDGFEIDGNRFSKEFLQACEIISKHQKAAVYVGCDAKGSGSNKWILDQVTIDKIKGKLK